jgi:hypothetical protein
MAIDDLARIGAAVEEVRTLARHVIGDALHDAMVAGPFAVSQDRVPLDVGALQHTGRVSDWYEEGERIVCTLSYGNQGDETGIVAIVQHERTDYQHPDPGRTAKYVENPMLEWAPRARAEIAIRARAGLSYVAR